ncbi:hypothetical protein Lser_V15G43741 [Lactuca serriola]
MAGENPPMIALNPDGSYTRNISFPSSLPTPDKDSDTPVLSKDVVINNINKTSVRIHIPKETAISMETPLKNLPLIVYFHGGGFVLMSAASTIVHDFCDHLAAELPAVVVSVDYRLAPENRLPAAYDDALEVLLWIKSAQDPWLTNYADVSSCYMMGTSAGANIAYHAGVRVSQRLHELESLKIKGLILHHVYFGGEERTLSEIQLAEAGQLTLATCDFMWGLSLPVDAISREHEYCNPMAGGGLDDISRIKEVGWRVMVTGCSGDLLIDRQREFAKTLELKGVENTCLFEEGGDHGIEYFDKSKVKDLFKWISSVMSTNETK